MSEEKPEAPLSLPLELTPDAKAFLVATTGIQDVDALREHILQIREDAMKVFPYPCIWRFDFASSHIQNLPRYDAVLALAKERPDALLLDIGCGFGQDVRRLVLDGYPPRNIIASDLRQGLWDLGHRFFRSDPATFSVKFIQGDILDPTFTSTSPNSDIVPNSNPNSLPTKSFMLIHASYLFHLFPEPTQHSLARTLLSLLSPSPGSMILGTHIGRRVRGTRVAKRAPAPGCEVASLFCHSVESWREMWCDVIKGEGKDGDGKGDNGGEGEDGKGVEVEVRLVEDRPDLADEDPTTPFLLLQWAVIRR